jgi:hypothetical protein
METIREYLADSDDFTAAEVEQAVKIEAELNTLVRERFTELVTMKFVCAVPDIRKLSPAATVESIFNKVLRYGLDAVIDDLEGKARPALRKTAKPKRKSGSTLK